MISIVTAGSRPENFEIVYNNILEIFGEEDYYWYLMCDPNNLLWMYKHAEDFPDKFAFVFRQLKKSGITHQYPEYPSKPGWTDTGNVLIHRKAIFVNWDTSGAYCEDFRFYYANYNIKPEYWKTLDITAAYYNYLRED